MLSIISFAILYYPNVLFIYLFILKYILHIFNANRCEHNTHTHTHIYIYIYIYILFHRLRHAVTYIDIHACAGSMSYDVYDQ